MNQDYNGSNTSSFGLFHADDIFDSDIIGPECSNPDIELCDPVADLEMVTNTSINRKDSTLDKKIFYLPTEIWLDVMSHLDGMSIISAGQVSRHFRRMSNDTRLWRCICKRYGLKDHNLIFDLT